MTEPGEPLSEREIEILRLVAAGLSNKEIARELVISPNTVKVHLRNVFAKIDVLSRTEATLYAIKTGLVPSPDIDSNSSSSTANQEAAFSGLEDLTSPTESITPLPRRTLLLWISVVVVAVLAAALALANTLLRPNNPLTAPTGEVTQRWQVSLAMPAPRSAMGAVIYNNQVYLVGGDTSAGPSAGLLALDLSQETWTSLPDKPTAVSGVQAALIGEKIYVPGGETADGNLTDVLEVYDPRQGEWTAAQPLPKPLSQYALCAFEGDLYLFGGWDGKGYSGMGYRYDPDQDAWQSFPMRAAARSLSAASALEGRIILVGGRDASRSLRDTWFYYPNREGEGSSAWEPGPNLPDARFGLSAASLANAVYVAGGAGSVRGDAEKAQLSALVLTNDGEGWQPIGLPGESIGSQAVLLASGNYLHVFGGQNGETISAQHLVYQALYSVSIPLISNE